MNEQEKQERREMLDKWTSEKSLEEIECHLSTITERIYKLVEQHQWDLERIRRRYELYRDHLFQIRDSRLMVEPQVCSRCGSEKPVGESCGCWDNHCQ